MSQQINPCLWFASEAEEAARYYTAIFPDGRITDVTRYGSAGPLPEGTVMTVTFELGGVEFVALNGGPADFAFNESLSFVVNCANQEEVDHYWNAFTAEGEEGPCGWVKDQYGVSWQIVPTVLTELVKDPDTEKAQRVMKAMLGMRRIEIAELERAAAS